MNVFDTYSVKYDNWYEKNKLAYLSELEALKRVVPKEGKGLEIGVGTGRFAKPLGISVGLDPSEKMLQIAKKRGIKTVVGRGEDLPFAGNEFDFVLIAITICFVDNPEKVILESRRVLKDNGKLIIGLVDKDSHLGKYYLKKKEQGHIFYKAANFFSAREIIDVFKRYNFKNIVIYQTIFLPLEKIKEIEKPKEGFSEGGFVVICGEKI